MNKQPFTVALALLAALSFLASAAFAQGEPTLKIGDKAPPLSEGEWVKGEPVTEFEPGKVYVMEFWATWCGPCIAAIPHVTELQKKHADDGLVVIGQNVFETDASAVKPFVEQMGDKMDYRVVMDSPSGPEGHMATKWMQAAGQNGIPCSFIIDQQGKIAWIGHPMQMDEPLAKIIAGEYDPQAEAEKNAKFQQLNQQLMMAAQSGDIEQAMKVLDQMAEVRPELAGQLAMVRFQILGQNGQWDKAYEAASAGIDQTEDAMMLNELAWLIVAPDSQLPQKNLEVAMKAAEKANKLSNGEDPAILDTLARVHFEQGGRNKAIELQQKAVDLAADEALKQELQRTLEEYKQAQQQ